MTTKPEQKPWPPRDEEVIEFIEWFTSINPYKGLIADYEGAVEGKCLAITPHRMKTLLYILNTWKDANALADESNKMLVEALEFYANYMSGDNPEFTKQGWQKYPDPKIAREALEKWRETNGRE